ncbi:junctional adhesion molecule-like isoform X2 [Silurus meridionalis]|uniref:junctional adhesion molecule-like isoform X2 n=1 Tax=Silurus meridionalis TaxID=175797 RepID=UPI001EEB2B12|nr:junctional adhesion molecule-like isoform X2 [Silurus meridionalis]
MYFSVLLMFVYGVGHEALRVHGPSDPLVAQLGGSVLLPCFIESSLPLEDLQVEWRKMDSDSVVSLFQQGKSRPDLQTQVFRDRAGFFPDEVSKGNFSILLKNVVKENAGVYRCQVNTTQDTGEVIMEIKEIKHFVVKGADHAVFARDGEDVILNCSVDSHVPASEIEEVTWKKTDGDQDILVLLYQNSEIFPDSSHESYQGRVDLFSSEISKGNFSLQLKDVKMEDKGEFTCEVHTSDMSARTTVVLHGVEHFVVKGADHAVFARDGEDVILNCSVDSHVPASEIEEVTWKKTDGDQDILVLLYQNSEIFPDSSHESYQGMVDLFSSEISKGNFSLHLKDVKMEDKGEFTCEVHTSDMSASTTVLLHGVEHFVVKGADHAVFAHEGEDVILNCSVDSHVPGSEIEEVTWKKTDGDQDILVLLYQNSEIFPESSHESYRGRVDLFLSEITKGTSH